MQLLSVNMPSLLVIGFLIGIILIILGNRELEDLARRNRLMKTGISIVGIMIPITPISWYGYWVWTSGTVLTVVDYLIIAIAIIVGLLVIYRGFTSFKSSQ
ncbi:MAG: hypothetical protein ACFFDM_10105 [Candidatus Thorarchaeota archaeon]